MALNLDTYMIDIDFDTKKTLEEIAAAIGTIPKVKCKIKKGVLKIKKNGKWACRGEIRDTGDSRIGSINVVSNNVNHFNEGKTDYRIALKKLGMSLK